MQATVKTRRSFAKVLANYSFIAIWLVIFLAYLVINGEATTLNGVMNILRHSAVVGVIALGMGLTIITGGIDLSVGSMLALIGGFSVEIFNMTDNSWLTLLFALLFGCVLGFANGFLIGKVKMPAFIVTLSTMLIYRSLSQYYLRVSSGKSIFQMLKIDAPDGGLTELDRLSEYFGKAKLFDVVPMTGIVLILVTALIVYLSTCTKFGKSVFAIGSNEKAARLAGINVEWTRVLVYVICGCLCGLATFLWLAMNKSVDAATIGKSNEMYAIAAVVIGGISMSGGKGKLLGVLFGAMSYTIIDKIIASLKLDALINDTIKGAILLLAVFVQIMIPSIRAMMAQRRLMKENAKGTAGRAEG